jgi:hypothetical protein
VDRSTNLLKKGQGNVLLEPDLKLLLEYFSQTSPCSTRSRASLSIIVEIFSIQDFDIVHVYKVDLLASRSCNAQITSIYIRAPNAWLCRIQREDFEIVLGSKVAERRFEAGSLVQLPNLQPGRTTIPITRYATTFSAIDL